MTYFIRCPFCNGKSGEIATCEVCHEPLPIGWVEVSVADNNQFRGPEGEGDFLSPPPALGGKRYYQNR